MRLALGVSAFGINEIRLPAGVQGPPHDEAEYAEEEVYVGLAGGGTVTVDDEVLAFGAGKYLRVDPRATRAVEAGPEGLTFLAIGGGAAAAAAGQGCRSVRSNSSSPSRRARKGAAPTQKRPIASAETVHLLRDLWPMSPSTSGTRRIADSENRFRLRQANLRSALVVDGVFGTGWSHKAPTNQTPVTYAISHPQPDGPPTPTPLHSHSTPDFPTSSSHHPNPTTQPY